MPVEAAVAMPYCIAVPLIVAIKSPKFSSDI